MKRSQAFYILKLLLFFLSYYYFAKYSLQFNPINGFATLLWIPTGFSLWVILMGGFKYLPGIVLGAFLANITMGAPLFAASGIAFGNTLEAATGAYLLKHFIRFHFTFDRLIDVFGLIVFACLVSTFLSATIGVTSLLLSGIVTYASYTHTWIAWWIGDMVSNLLIAPLLLVWTTRIVFFKKTSQFVEGFLWLFVVASIWVIIFQNVFSINIANSPRTYWVFPPLIWAALRFGQRWTITTIFFIALIAIVATLNGASPFVNAQMGDSLIALYIYMIVITATSMILAAVVSERKQLEKRKDNFISIASHELKTPITSSKSYVQVLKKRLQKDKKAESDVYLLSKTDEQLDKMTMLINDLLDVSKIQSGKLELRQKKFDVDAFVKANVESFQQSTTTHKVKREGEVKKKIYGDEHRLSQVLTNLLTNAVKYSPGANKVIVKTAVNKKQVTIRVQDFGMGMSTDAQKKIFEPFFQIAGVKRDGLGLGLHIASEIVRGHGGTIWVETKKDKGSTFSFSLPLQQRKGIRKRIF